MPSKNVRNRDANGKAAKAKENFQTASAEKFAATKLPNSARVVTADSVQSEEVPTVPLGSLETVNALQAEVAVRSVASSRAVNTPAPLVVQPSEYRRSMNEWLQVWWDGIRPSYLLLSLVPACVGSILAWVHTINNKTPFGHFHTTHFIGILAAILMIQTGANLINDYYDYLRGVDISNTFGPGGLIQQGLVKPPRILSLGLTSLILGAIIGCVIAASGGPLVYLFGVIGLLCAFFYSATARSLSSLALGELAGFFVFGPLITCGAYLVMAQTGGIASAAFTYSIPLGLFAVAAIHANNMRDIEGDAHAKRLTLASILGMRWSRWLYGILLIAAYLVVVVIALPHGTPHFMLLTLWTLPLLVVALTGIIRSGTTSGMHLLMRQTLRLETYFALFLLIGLLITALLPVLPNLPAHLIP